MEQFLNSLKKYQRPVRTVLWTFLITISYLVCLFGSKPCPEGFVVETILIAMFIDMGIYTITRTFEKTKNLDNNAN